ncbi:MAG: YraN family protein [Acidimicrobiia bacterium]
MSRDPRRALGASGEDLAARWYAKRGYLLLDRNWRCREGELDLVLSAKRTVVFCEVKTRRSDAFGAPFEAVTPTKQRRLRGLAARWLDEHPQRGVDLRFDVASVYAPRGEAPRVEVIEAAF